MSNPHTGWANDVVPPVDTPRLLLSVLSRDVLAAIAEGRFEDASHIFGGDLTGFPDEERGIAAIRPRDLEADPAYLPWSLRAMLLKPELRFVGYFNFHSRPDPDYLRELAPHAIELGYYVLPPHRRNGIAEEAARGMMDWAADIHGINRFVVSISPQNAPSVAMARKLGFARIGGHIDETDGYEDIPCLTRPL